MSAKLQELEKRIEALEAKGQPKDAEPAKKRGRPKVKGAKAEGSVTAEGADAA